MVTQHDHRVTQDDPRETKDDPRVTQDDLSVTQDDPWVTQDYPRGIRVSEIETEQISARASQRVSQLELQI